MSSKENIKEHTLEVSRSLESEKCELPKSSNGQKEKENRCNR